MGSPQPHAMIDLETLGLNICKAPILQAAVTLFHPRQPGIVSAWSTRVSLGSNLAQGRQVEDKTENWWKDQDPDLYAKLMSGQDDLVVALGSLAAFLQSNNVGEVWSNGSTFDIAMLAIAYADLDVDLPWNFRLVRDTRTVWALAADKCPSFLDRTSELQKVLGWQRYEGDDIPHDALSDCLRQTLMVQMAYAIIDLERPSLKQLFL